MSILVVAGTRPEAIKLATVVRDLRAGGLHVVYAWTGQHHAAEMAGDAVVRAVPSWPLPDVVLSWGSRPAMPWRIRQAWESLRAAPPEAVLVQGDTASALAGAYAVEDLGARLIHLEAGLRSWLPDQVEERIRRNVDRRADLLLCPSPLAAAFARVDAKPDAEVVVVGQTGLDAFREAAVEGAAWPEDLADAVRDPAPWALLTLHRAELVDDPARLGRVVRGLVGDAGDLRLVWALHPRVRERATVEAAYADVLRHALASGVRLVDPIPYAVTAAMLAGDRRPEVVVTDSGGLVEEAYLVGLPTLIVRDATERWEALVEGPAALLRPDDVPDHAERVLRQLRQPRPAPWPRQAYGWPDPHPDSTTRPTSRAVAAIRAFLTSETA